MNREGYSYLIKRLEALEELEKAEHAEKFPYYVVVAPSDGRRVADMAYHGGFTAYELYKREGKPDVVRKIALTDFTDYKRPRGCFCPCLYMVRRKCLEAAGNSFLPSFDDM